MDRWQNRVAVVTGASSGIGSAIVVDLVKAGCIVAGLARRVERVEELRAKLPTNLQNKLHPVKCDVSDQQSVNKAFDWIIQKLGGVDILVNNAGTLNYGKMVTQDLNSINQVLQTNVMGVVSCTQRAFKSMKERNFDGHIILINSIAGHQVFSPAPDMPIDLGIYSASKYAVTAINEILRHEFRTLDTKIKVTSISPGHVDTEIVPEPMKALNLPVLKSEDVSNAVMFVISTPPHVQIQELTIKPVGEHV